MERNPVGLLVQGLPLLGDNFRTTQLLKCGCSFPFLFNRRLSQLISTLSQSTLCVAKYIRLHSNVVFPPDDLIFEEISTVVPYLGSDCPAHSELPIVTNSLKA